VSVDPSLHERQRLLKKARLADSLNEKLSHRPGVLDLVQANVLQPDGKLGQLIKGTDRISMQYGTRLLHFYNKLV